MDALWQPTKDSTKIIYYRAVTYKDNKPLGLVTDYYRDGTKQYEGRLIEDRPEEIMDGEQTWYYPSGEKRVVELYDKGKSLNQKILLRSGEPAELNWVTDHYRKGEKLSDEKNYKESEKEFLISLENAEAFYSRESEEYATVADWLGIVCGLQNKYEQTIYFKEEVVAVRKIIHSQPDTLLLNTLSSLGSHYRRIKDWSASKAKLKEFLNYNSSYFNGNHPDLPSVLQDIGTACYYLHDYSSALTYLSDAKIIFDADPIEHEYLRLSNIFNLATLYFDMGELTSGEQLLASELPKLKKQYGETSEYYYTALGLLARIHVGEAKYAIAETEWNQVLSVIGSTRGAESEEYAQILASLAELFVAKGDIPKADEYINKAKKIYETKVHTDPAYLEFLSKLSLIYTSLGNYEKLQATAQQRKEIAANLFGSKSLEYARTLLLLTDVSFARKDWETCLSYIKEAVGIYSTHDFNSLSDLEKRNLSLLKSRLGTIYLMQNLAKPEAAKLTSAGQYTDEAISIFESLRERAFSPDFIDTYLVRATIHELNQEPRQADRDYTYVYNQVKAHWGENHPFLINVLFLIAKKSELREDYATSFANYKKAIVLHQKYIQRVFPYLSEVEKEQFYETTHDVIRSFMGFAAQHSGYVPGLAESWCNLVLDQKGIVLHSLHATREAIYSSTDSQLKNLFVQWQQLKNEYGKMLQEDSYDKNLMEKKKDYLNGLEKQISAKVADAGLSLTFSSVSWKEVQKSLTANEAAVEIVFTISDKPEGIDTSYYALVIKPSLTKPEIVRLGSARDLEGRSFKFYRNSIKSLQQDLVSYSHYWEPLQKSLQGSSTVYCSADGIFHQINFGTLYNPNTNKFLGEEKNIHYVPSTTRLLKKKSPTPDLNNFVVFAHPNYGAPSAEKKADLTRSLDLENVSDLPGTALELTDLTSLMTEGRIPYAAYQGADATEEAIKKIKSAQALHIATHGYFLTKPRQGKATNPLTRSGLLFAGCQQKIQSTNNQNEDGILTAYEASTLPLHQTVLVALSACETGLGEVKNGEGVYGLQRAFFMAGTRNILMSLWKVDDEATHLFMTAFYRAWIKNKSLTEAYRAAQQAVKEKYPEPFYWGAFILSGG
ncbi:MAG: CHAT domain-containing protein [Bacteroidetes bacterium]|nr:CHAT domain-containing protein [Bacteroidota bacterium]